MELRTLAYAEAVARLGSFTGAARELHVAQPAVSAQIANLERELGTVLFTRMHRHVAPTAAGERVVARARAMLGQVDALRTDLAELDGLLSGRVRLGATSLRPDRLDLPAAAAAFHTAHPAVRLQITSDYIAPLLAGLDTGTLDLVIGPLDAAARHRYATRVLAEETVVLITARGRRPVAKTLADVAAAPWVCLRHGSGLHAILTDAARAAGFTPDIVVEASGPHQIREFVAAGLGVALVAASVAGAPGPPVRITRLDPSPPHPPLGVIHRRGDDSPALTAFAAQLTSALR